MRRMLAVILLLAVIFIDGRAGKSSSPLVTPSWLMENRNDPNLVVLHVAFNRRDYAREHIPGARFVWWTWLVPSTPDYSSELPSVADVDSLLEGLGISNTSRIVVCYTRGFVVTGTRVLYTLQYFGLGNRSYLLDGGLDAWKSMGGETTAEIPVVRRTSLDLRPDTGLMADADFIKAARGTPGVMVVDARTRAFYDGGSTGNPRQGHIAGAVSIPYSSLTDSLSWFKPVDELKKIFRDAGVMEGDVVVPYCHVGQQATVVFQAARMLGHKARLYDGSMEDWSYLDETYPMNTVESKKD